MRPYLLPGRAPARMVYRWLRHCERDCGDVYLEVDLPEVVPDRVAAALRELDLACKTLEWGDLGERARYAERMGVRVSTLPWFGRTRTWRGSQRYWDAQNARRLGRLGRPWDHVADRPIGMRYARLVARLLRAAAEERCVGVVVWDEIRRNRPLQGQVPPVHALAWRYR